MFSNWNYNYLFATEIIINYTKQQDKKFYTFDKNNSTFKMKDTVWANTYINNSSVKATVFKIKN